MGIVRTVTQPTAARHDPRLDPPSRSDRRRVWAWLSVLAFSPICLGVVVWAALDLNGSYPTVKPPVPRGYQAVPGIYASMSVPKGWSLQQDLSDSNGDIYYSGHSGGVGLSVEQQGSQPSHTGAFPEIVGSFLGGRYRLRSVVPVKLAHAAAAWDLRFSLPGGQTGAAVLAWSRQTQSEVWLVATTLNPATERVLGTLTLAP